jgi:hypothetical protein
LKLENKYGYLFDSYEISLLLKYLIEKYPHIAIELFDKYNPLIESGRSRWLTELVSRLGIGQILVKYLSLHQDLSVPAYNLIITELLSNNHNDVFFDIIDLIPAKDKLNYNKLFDHTRNKYVQKALCQMAPNDYPWDYTKKLNCNYYVKNL